MSAKYCPLCGKENDCVMAVNEFGHCWCSDENFPSEIFDLVPEESRNKHCICRNCLNEFREKQNGHL